MPGDALRIAPDVVTVELDGRCCVYAPGSAQVLLLDDAGTLVWSLLGEGSTQPSLLEDLVAVTGASPTEVVAPLDALLDLLVRAQAVTVGTLG